MASTWGPVAVSVGEGPSTSADYWPAFLLLELGWSKMTPQACKDSAQLTVLMSEGTWEARLWSSVGFGVKEARGTKTGTSRQHLRGTG